MSATSAPVWLPFVTRSGGDEHPSGEGTERKDVRKLAGGVPAAGTATHAPGTSPVEEGEVASSSENAPAPGTSPDGAYDQLTSSGRIVATSSVSAEAQQGDGPAAASASSSAVGTTTDTKAVSVVVGPNGASAACPFGVVVVGPQGAAAASEVGVATVGAGGAAAASNAANSVKAVSDGKAVSDVKTARHDVEQD